jgi:hypothetical protein
MSTRTARVCAIALACGGVSTPALAGDLNPPPWRGQPGTTFQYWQFASNTDIFPNPFNNPNGVPSIGTGGVGISWQPGPAGTGVWCINPGGFLPFIIPNDNEPTMHKELWFQIKYYSPGTEPAVSVTDPLGAGPWAPGPFVMTPTVISPGPPPLWYSAGSYVRDYCPAFETVTIRNPNPNEPIYIEQFVVDTRCIPAPAGLGVLAAAGVLASHRRR